MHCETTNSSLLTFIAAMLLSFLGYLQSRQSGFRFPKVGSRWKSLVLRDWRTGMEMSRHWTWSAFAFQGRRQQLHGKYLRAKCSTFFNSKDYLYLYYVHTRYIVGQFLNNSTLLNVGGHISPISRSKHERTEFYITSTFNTRRLVFIFFFLCRTIPSRSRELA